MLKKLFSMEIAKVATLVLTLISVSLLVGSFFCPPMGQIDGSVLAGVGELFAFAALWVGAHAINEKGAHAEIKHGNTSVTIDTDEE